jgi:predicted TIM-barrel fold metal-dependent hydrolase
VIAHLGHPWFDEAIAVVRRHPHVYADISGLVTRRWLLYQALVSAIEYRVDHKLLFGSDFPFFSARQTIDGLRSVTGTAFGPDMPMVAEQVVEDIIHRPTLDLLEITAPS